MNWFLYIGGAYVVWVFSMAVAKMIFMTPRTALQFAMLASWELACEMIWVWVCWRFV